MNIATYLARVYPDPPCWALVADVYTAELGLRVDEYRTINNSARAAAKAFRFALHASQHGFAQIAEPQQWCVVLMGKSASLGLHHAGVYVDGKVLHALPEGNLHQDLASLRDGYQLMEFWAR